MRALRGHPVSQRLIHTGQHYDSSLSDSFFEDLRLPRPDVALGVGSGSHAVQTAKIMVALETHLTSDPPDLIVVYGDINSTLAAALVGSKLGIRLAHVEAGLRSRDRSMPEELNRILTDQLSSLHFVTSPEAIGNLAMEGIDIANAHLVGNPMIDTLMENVDQFEPGRIRAELGVESEYAVATLHRPGNVDSAAKAREVIAGLRDVADLISVVLPVHPRGRSNLVEAGVTSIDNVVLVDPLRYVDFISLVRGARLVVTDSGGIQEETTAMRIPCITLRPNTERPITITHGTNQLASPQELASRVASVLGGETLMPTEGPPLWDGRAGERIARLIMAYLRTTAH